MTKALVVFESMFGDAQQVAEAIARGLSSSFEVQCVEVGTAEATVPTDVRLLIVGGPNHGFSLPSENSRRDAATKTDQALVSAGIGLREWLEDLAEPAEPTYAATFDTRMSHPKMLVRMDHAAASSGKRLKKLGFHLAVPSEHFLVQDVTGPLVDGEAERAEQWGLTVAQHTAPSHTAG
jgi:Flavodoxin